MKIKLLIIGVLFAYPIIELSRLIIVYPWPKDMLWIPVVELIFMWTCFFLGFWFVDKNVLLKTNNINI